MAHLLGSRYCIESLHDDVTDLQLVIVDVFSRAGPVKCTSWKYPDKLASDVNIDDLLECHTYSEDEEERQVAHIVLLELVIDRLLVLLQAMAQFLEKLLTRAGSAVNSSPSNTSVGLVVRKYWNKMVHLHTVTQQFQSETKTKARKIIELEEEVEKLREVVDTVGDAVDEAAKGTGAGAGASPGGINLDVLLPGGLDSASLAALMSARSKKPEISRDESNKACQTIETAFVPCEECDRVQFNLREIGHDLAAILTSQDMPSAIQRHLGYIKDLEWLTHHDVARWSAEQKKDLIALKKHMTWLRKKIDPLEELAREHDELSKKQLEKVSQLSKELALEKQTQSIQLSNFERKINEAKAEKQKEIDRVTRELTKERQEKKDIEYKWDTTRVKLQEQQDKLQLMETEQVQMREELEKSQTDNTEIRRLKSDVKHLECQLDKARGRMSEVTRELNKEKARNKSVNKHTESLQGKQESLLERIDSLDVENDDLRSQVADLHEEKDGLDDALHAAKTKSTMALETNTQQEAKLQRALEQKAVAEARRKELEGRVQAQEERLEELKEHQRLIVEYPDLHGPVNRDLAGTGDVAVDMENQVKANAVRIQVLEDQNESLRKTINKMLQLQGQHSNVDSAMPTPLWKPRESTQRTGAWQGHLEGTTSHHTLEEEDLEEEEEEEFQHHLNSEKQVKLFHKRSLPDKPPPPTASHRERDWVPTETLSIKGANSGGSSSSRPKSGKPRPSSAKVTSNNASCISAYVQLKRAGMIKSANPAAGRSRPPSGKPKPPASVDQGSITCDKCDRTFHHRKDLDIHRNYCFGGL